MSTYTLFGFLSLHSFSFHLDKIAQSRRKKLLGSHNILEIPEFYAEKARCHQRPHHCHWESFEGTTWLPSLQCLHIYSSNSHRYLARNFLCFVHLITFCNHVHCMTSITRQFLLEPVISIHDSHQ